MQGTADDHLIALYADDDHIAVGAVVVDNPRAFLKVRKAIARRVTVDEIELPSVALPAAP